jgi:GntR family transcriptional regulator
MPLTVHITPGATVPIHQQISDQVRRAVARGGLEAGEKLPSVRQLAEELTINPNTVARAYNDLAREGFMESRPGVGAFVARKRKVFTRQERLRRLRPKLEDLVQSGLALDFTAVELQELLASHLAEFTDHPPT